MYCTHCGKEVDNNLSQYPYCSTPISMTKTENKENKGNVCQEVIGYCFPISFALSIIGSTAFSKEVITCSK